MRELGLKVSNKVNAKQLGIWAEHRAVQLLLEQQYVVLKQNYHSRYGEIDIIAARGSELVFVEVKARTKTLHGHAHEVVTTAKQRKIVQTALMFITEYEQYAQFYYRFDVICFDFNQQIAKNLQQGFSELAYDQQWIENAFTLDADLINL